MTKKSKPTPVTSADRAFTEKIRKHYQDGASRVSPTLKIHLGDVPQMVADFRAKIEAGR